MSSDTNNSSLKLIINFASNSSFFFLFFFNSVTHYHGQFNFSNMQIAFCGTTVFSEQNMPPEFLLYILKTKMRSL